MTLLAVAGLRVHIGQQEILRGISLDCAAGEVLGLIGESGSGKSMAALAMMGLLPAPAVVQGSIRLEGQELVGRPEAGMCALRGRALSMVFQEPMTALNPMQTIGDQVAETVRVHAGASRRAALAHARETLARVGLPEATVPASRFPHELSGGQRQRVGIAIAIALHPRLLIADEPTTALDVSTQAGILALLRRLVDEDGLGLVFISHDLAVVSRLADRLAILRAGEVVERGAAAEVFRTRAHPYTRALLDAATHRPDRRPPEAEPAPPLLELSGVTRDYPAARHGLFGRRGRFPAVRGVSFAVRAGESVGLVGRSGCGKSTLTRAILGLEPLQGGEIRLGGRPAGPGMRRDQRALVQVVFQDPYGSFDPRQTVGRLITEPLHLLDDPPRGADRAAAIARALGDVGLSATDAGRYIHEFSGGQRQRLAIARALILRPRLILLDEAVSALDVRVRAQILDLLARLSARYGLAYLFISHDLGVVRAITDRVLVMEAGRIVEEGPTEAVLAAPRHPATRALVAAAPALEMERDIMPPDAPETPPSP